MNVMEKEARQTLVKNIIQGMQISNQDELSSALAERGVMVTQATLSRDLKALGIIKLHSENGYFYAVPGIKQIHDGPSGIISIEISGQMAVIKTQIAYANVAALAIDAANLPGIMGTIAGDDTILVILKEGTDKSTALGAISIAIPGIKDKLI